MKLMDINIKLTFLAIFFCNGKHMISFANVEYQIFNKHLMCLIIILDGFVDPK
jgi:hypothetical protein